MVPNLVLCAGCRRHFRPRDPVCPFCGTSVVEASARRIPALASGASRSRRYAASAALLAGGAVFACGSGSNDDPATGNGNDTGGVTSAGQGQGGRASGGRDSSGGKNSGGMNTTASGGDGGSEQGDGGASDSGGATQSSGGKSSTGGVTASGGTQSGGGGVPPAAGRACDGFTDRAGCRTAADCQALPGTTEPPTCVMTLPARGCGNPTFLPVCPDAGCPDGQVCRPLECGESCQPACSDSNCSGTNECVDGECRAKPCDEGGEDCADGYECDPAATQFPTHCAPISCSDGAECDSWRSCGEGAPRDANGCGPKACTTDTDCGDCGYCVNAACEPTLGVCYQFLAMPYGCVWPDEELI